jgi:anti-sigma regulatory factor (Ser/Thr protein kinase)
MSSPEPIDYAVQPLPALVRVTQVMAAEANPAQAVWDLVQALREDLPVDRAGVFAYNPETNSVELITGVGEDGQPEFGARSYSLETGVGPLVEVARRELPYYFSNRLREDYPQGNWPARMTAHGIVPVIGGDRLLGTLNIDNALTGREIPESILQPLFLYAGLAALPLFALYQQRERERTEQLRRDIMREMLHAVTNGKVVLCEREEIDREWPILNGKTLQIERREDVPPWRDKVREAGIQAGMTPLRAGDLEICAAEAASNALCHGNGGKAGFEVRGESVRVRVVDQGSGIDPQNLPRATLMAGASSKDSAGLGYTLMMDLADRVYLYTGPDGTNLIIEMCVEPPLNLPEGWAELL